MYLVDTSIWIDHLKKGNHKLSELLAAGQVITHPFVIEELACGRISNRNNILKDLEKLPKCSIATHSEFIEFVANKKLYDKGLSSIDIHLLISCLIEKIELFTFDKSLIKAYNLLS